MTAVVGILNRRAVAIAADSAVTVNGKIFNRAMKIFTLSKYHPVGIMIYNLDSFMQTPWETIIKMYRKNLYKKHFPTIEAYQVDFIKFLRDRNFFIDEEHKIKYLENQLEMSLTSLISEAIKGNEWIRNQAEPTRQTEFERLMNEKTDFFIRYYSALPPCIQFADFTIAMFNTYFNDVINRIIDRNITRNLITITTELNDKIRLLLFSVIKAREEFLPYTGLVFVGFGEQEIYPSLIKINISFSVGDRLKYFSDMPVKVSHENYASIQPFAQRDAMMTILKGVSPKLETIFNENFQKFFTKYNEQILSIIGDGNSDLSQQISGIDKEAFFKEFIAKNEEAKNVNYIHPLLSAVANLSKEDLAEMAESLIYLTFLQKRITLAEENVGGAVDVAIISKGDGFVWIKRKHYFKPELNQHFFDNYFNK